MTDTPQISVVTRTVPGLTIIALIVMIAAAIFHVVTLSPAPEQAFDRADAPAAPIYSESASWLAEPATLPEGGWERPWGIDLFWLTDQPDGYFGGWNIPLDWAPNDAQMTEEAWLSSDELIEISLYAPRRRHVSSATGEDVDAEAAADLENEDVLAAIDLYLDERNQSRGIFLGGAGTGISSVVSIVDERLADTKPYDQLLGGIVISPESNEFADGILPPWPDCEETITEFPCLLDLRKSVEQESPIERLNRTFDKFSTWLDQNVTKPAAPLPPFETIELSPIRRPGEVVEEE